MPRGNNEMLDSNSKFAVLIIGIFQSFRDISYEQRQFLLEQTVENPFLIPLLKLIFSDKIIRIPESELNLINLRPRIKNADKTLNKFIKAHHKFYKNKISYEELVLKIKKLIKSLHVRESIFYKSLLTGCKFSMDYEMVKQVVGEDFAPRKLPKFSLGVSATSGWKFNIPALIQPQIDGLHVKVSFRNKANIVARNGRKLFDYEELKWAAKVINKKYGQFQMDCIIYSPEITTLNGRLLYTKEIKNYSIFIYDIVFKEDVTAVLENRHALLCKIIKALKKKYKTFDVMPTTIVTSKNELKKCVKAFNKKYSKLPAYKGVFVKCLRSKYKYGRNETWAKLPCREVRSFVIKSIEVSTSILTKNVSSGLIKSMIGKLDDGTCIRIRYPERTNDPILADIDNLIGCVGEFEYINDIATFKRLLPDKGINY